MSSIFPRLSELIKNIRNSEKPRRLTAFFVGWPKWVRWTALAVLVVGIGAGSFAVVKANQVKTAATQTATLQTATARKGSLVLEASGTGYLVAASEASVSFDTTGKITNLYVKLGDQVDKGELLAELDASSQQTALENAKAALQQMTSAEAVATAQQTIAADELTVYNAQVTLNSLKNWQNAALAQEYYAKLVMAKDQLDKAQSAYDGANVGEYINNTREAQLYQNLYTAQQAYKTASFYYSLYSQKPTQRQYDAAQAALDLANADLENAKNYLTAITGGTVAEDASGSALEQFRQAKLAVQTAQENLDATKLYAPISGTVMTLNATLGQAASGTIMTIDDLSTANIQFYMDSSDWTNVKVGYEVSVTFDALNGKTFSGTVTQVMPGLVSVQGSSMVEGFAELQNSVSEIGLPVGVEAAIDVISGQASDAVLVPVEALHQLSDGSYTVFVMVDGKPTLRTVEVGLKDDTFAVIKSGVNAGDVVTTGIVETK
ncbi:MAG TPA: efflux RND transporter periplasmic adaptor subunit [Anaerolineales bacterium]|nr:efflux RND transporter periplasmic adaptor subunit [Anaerolineales bacterium]